MTVHQHAPHVDQALDPRVLHPQVQEYLLHADDEESSTTERAGEWPILACVFRYQTTPLYLAMWVSGSETVYDLQERAFDILQPGGFPAEVVLVDPSPVDSAISFVVVPTWWREIQQTLCVVRWPPESAPPFAEVMFPESCLADLVRDLPAEAGLRLDFHVSGLHAPRLPAALHLPFRPPNGTLVEVYPEGRDRDGLLTTQMFVSEASNALATEGSLPTTTPHPDTWLVLGPHSEQVVLHRNEEPAHLQVATTMSIQPPDLILVHCQSPFDEVAVNGTSVSHIVSARTVRLLGQSHRGSLIFVDPREIGLPVCTRVLFKQEATPRDVLAVDAAAARFWPGCLSQRIGSCFPGAGPGWRLMDSVCPVPATACACRVCWCSR